MTNYGGGGGEREEGAIPVRIAVAYTLITNDDDIRIRICHSDTMPHSSTKGANDYVPHCIELRQCVAHHGLW